MISPGGVDNGDKYVILDRKFSDYLFADLPLLALSLSPLDYLKIWILLNFFTRKTAVQTPGSLIRISELALEIFW